MVDAVRNADLPIIQTGRADLLRRRAGDQHGRRRPLSCAQSETEACADGMPAAVRNWLRSGRVVIGLGHRPRHRPVRAASRRCSRRTIPTSRTCSPFFCRRPGRRAATPSFRSAPTVSAAMSSSRLIYGARARHARRGRRVAWARCCSARCSAHIAGYFGGCRRLARSAARSMSGCRFRRSSCR